MRATVVRTETNFDSAARRKVWRLAGFAEAPSLERDPRENRERVVGEERIDVLVSNAGHFVNGLKARVVIENGLLRADGKTLSQEVTRQLGS